VKTSFLAAFLLLCAGALFAPAHAAKLKNLRQPAVATWFALDKEFVSIERRRKTIPAPTTSARSIA
jgi:hypothetical protein